MKNLSEKLGRRIVQLRVERSLTQEKLAYECGLKSKGYLSEIESGKKIPSLKVLIKIAERLDVDIKELFIFK